MDSDGWSARHGCRNRFCNLGATSHWEKLERPGNDSERPRTDPHRPVRAHPASDLHWIATGSGRNSDCHWRIPRGVGLCVDCGWFHGESETRRVVALNRVRALIPRTPPANGFFPSTLGMRFAFYSLLLIRVRPRQYARDLQDCVQR